VRGVAVGWLNLPTSYSSLEIFFTSEFWSVTWLPVRASVRVAVPLLFWLNWVV
jgi:hypothetical protein